METPPSSFTEGCGTALHVLFIGSLQFEVHSMYIVYAQSFVCGGLQFEVRST